MLIIWNKWEATFTFDCEVQNCQKKVLLPYFDQDEETVQKPFRNDVQCMCRTTFTPDLITEARHQLGLLPVYLLSPKITQPILGLFNDVYALHSIGLKLMYWKSPISLHGFDPYKSIICIPEPKSPQVLTFDKTRNTKGRLKYIWPLNAFDSPQCVWARQMLLNGMSNVLYNAAVTFMAFLIMQF